MSGWRVKLEKSNNGRPRVLMEDEFGESNTGRHYVRTEDEFGEE